MNGIKEVTNRIITSVQCHLWMGVILLGSFITARSGFAYPTYASGCDNCHGSFTGSTSPKGTTFPSNSKHEMHRGSTSMNTECFLCHTDIGDDPQLGSSAGTANNTGLGCSGCHVGSGLRAHHVVNGITTCYTSGCHDPETPPEEQVIPTYYGTADTKANNPCNDVLASKTNENWSVGDYLGLDNDGDNLYDLADYSCGPLQMVAVIPDGNDTRVRWETAGGRTERIQATSVLTNGFSDIGTTVPIPGVGIVTQEVVEANGADGPERFYRVRSTP